VIPTPDHLLDQAAALLRLYPGRRPRQTEIRRAISAAYYALFHFTLNKASDEFVGVRHRATPQYALAYRSISHAGLRDQCLLVTKTTIPDRLKPFVPPAGFGRDLRIFGTTLPELQDKRHLADYDPSANFVRAEAESMIAFAALGMARFASADPAERRAFLALLLFPARGRG
jgi:hypothetical protein